MKNMTQIVLRKGFNWLGQNIEGSGKRGGKYDGGE